MVIILLLLSVLIGFIFYLYIYPFFRMWRCKINDVYFKNIKDDNPFKKIREEYAILDIKGGYVLYEAVNVYFNGEEEYRQCFEHTENMYEFFHCTVLGMKKKK